MKVSTLVFIGSLLATSLEKVHSDNNEVSQQHRKDEEVTNINDIIGETPSGSIRASRRNESDTEEDVEQPGEELSIRASRRNDRKKEGEKVDISNEGSTKKKKKQQGRDTDEGTEEESNRRSGNKRGSDETGDKTSEHDGNDRKRGGRGGRNADKNDRFQKNDEEKKGGRGGGDGGGRADEEDTDQENKRKKNKRGNRVDGSTSGNQKKHSNEKKKKIKEGRKFRKRLDQENQQVTHSAGVPLVAPSEVVAEVPLPIEAEVDHEIMIESLMKAKSEKESGHQDAQMGMTPESAHTVDTLNTVTGDVLSKKKQRYEKKDRRRNHPRPQQPPSEFVGGPPPRVGHENVNEGQMNAKSEKESVHQDALTGMTPESAHTVGTLSTVTGDAISKKKQRYEKKDRRRNHPRPQEYPGSPPLHTARGSDAASRFVVPATAKMKQKTARKQRLSGGGKSEKMAP